MSVAVVMIAEGKQRQHVIDLPETLTISVKRQDGYAPSEMEIFTALTIALESMKPSKNKGGK